MARWKLSGGARPFLKWAGGKSQLLGEFYRRLPGRELETGALTHYVEPFVGGGAVYFSLARLYPFEECTISDVNEELVLTYRAIQNSVPALIERLRILDSTYRTIDESQREAWYYAIRNTFNRSRPSSGCRAGSSRGVERAAQMIFLNHTCYNGLYRVNKSGEFNVPFGRYKNPDILNVKNLEAAASLLASARILRGDFTRCRSAVDDRTFVYLDPPYRPLNATSSFTTYAPNGFSTGDQVRLAKFFRDLDRKGAKIMLSNSDLANTCPGDTFFEDLYEGFRIERVPAKRMINCNGARRGAISELIITNY